MRIPQNLLRVYNMLMKTPSSSSWHLLYNFSIEKISRMVWNNFMMHLCTVATLCFFKITSPRNYYYCDQDDFPWVCGSKYVSKSNCCHRHLVLYISDVKKFPYLPKIYISAIKNSNTSANTKSSTTCLEKDTHVCFFFPNMCIIFHTPLYLVSLW